MCIAKLLELPGNLCNLLKMTTRNSRELVLHQGWNIVGTWESAAKKKVGKIKPEIWSEIKTKLYLYCSLHYLKLSCHLVNESELQRSLFWILKKSIAVTGHRKRCWSSSGRLRNSSTSQAKKSGSTFQRWFSKPIDDPVPMLPKHSTVSRNPHVEHLNWTCPKVVSPMLHSASNSALWNYI